MDKTKMAAALFDKYAQKYQDKYMDISLYHDTLDLFCQAVNKENPKILELACGPGNITQYLLGRRPDFKLLGTDLSSRMIELAATNNPSAKFQLLDIRAIDKLTEKYDGIVCGFGLPYISKEEAIQFIEDAAVALPVAGVFYLSTMEGDYSKSGLEGPSSGGPDRVFIYYHQSDYLTKALHDSGMDVLKMTRIKYKGPTGLDVIDLVILAKKSSR